MSYIVLVVEDHVDSRDLLLRFLERKGLRAVACTDGSTALEIMRQQRPDVAILDEAMPGLSGSELFEKMKSDPRLCDIPVIFYSAHFDNTLAASALHRGAVDWLVKGVHSLDRVFATIEVAKGLRPAN